MTELKVEGYDDAARAVIPSTCVTADTRVRMPILQFDIPGHESKKYFAGLFMISNKAMADTLVERNLIYEGYGRHLTGIVKRPPANDADVEMGVATSAASPVPRPSLSLARGIATVASMTDEERRDVHPLCESTEVRAQWPQMAHTRVDIRPLRSETSEKLRILTTLGTKGIPGRMIFDGKQLERLDDAIRRSLPPEEAAANPPQDVLFQRIAAEWRKYEDDGVKAMIGRENPETRAKYEKQCVHDVKWDPVEKTFSIRESSGIIFLLTYFHHTEFKLTYIKISEIETILDSIARGRPKKNLIHKRFRNVDLFMFPSVLHLDNAVRTSDASSVY
jgi:hypothetical protein